MVLKIPSAFSHSNVKCEVRGLELRPGDTVKIGDYLAELRYEVVNDEFSDCPVVLYADLVADAEGVVKTLSGQLAGEVGMVIGSIGEDSGDFPVHLVTF